MMCEVVSWRRSFEKRRAEVRSVNRDMTQSTCLEETGLVVERRSAGSTTEARIRVALETEQIHVAYLQHVRVRATVDQMAGRAAINLHGRMLVDEWALLFGVALVANGVLRRGRAHLLRHHRSMDVVAVGALNQAFVDPMVKRHRELGLFAEVARVAQFRLRLDKQVFPCRGVMRRMTGHTAHSVLRVNRIQRVHMLRPANMAGQTACVDVL